jgi:cell division protein FtsQ
MGSNSHQRSGSSARSTGRRRVVIGAEDTSGVRYKKKERPNPEPLQSRRRALWMSDVVPPDSGEAGQRISKSKRDERERRQRQISRQRTALGVAAVALAAALIAGIVFLAQAPLFPIKSVTVTGIHRLTREQILARAAVPSDATLLRLPVSRIEQSIAQNPWVEKAQVVRHLPGTVELRVTERTPMAVVDGGGTQLWLVDGSGVWLAKASADQSPTLPTIRDVQYLAPQPGVQSPSKELGNALQVWEGISPDLRAQVRTISAPTIDRTTLLLPHGVEVLVGSSRDIWAKDKVARTVLTQHKNVVYVNVRVANSATWRGLGTAK